MERTFINLLKDDKGAVPQGYDCPFLIGYQYQGDDYILHLIVKTDEDRIVWICKLREGIVCELFVLYVCRYFFCSLCG